MPEKDRGEEGPCPGRAGAVLTSGRAGPGGDLPQSRPCFSGKGALFLGVFPGTKPPLEGDLRRRAKPSSPAKGPMRCPAEAGPASGLYPALLWGGARSRGWPSGEQKGEEKPTPLPRGGAGRRRASPSPFFRLFGPARPGKSFINQPRHPPKKPV